MEAGPAKAGMELRRPARLRASSPDFCLASWIALAHAPRAGLSRKVAVRASERSEQNFAIGDRRIYAARGWQGREKVKRGPATREQMIAAGYEFEFNRECSRCGVPIQFWKTPKGKLAPFELEKGIGKLVSHFALCPYSRKFRRT